MTDMTISRLRSANPVPDVPVLHDRELFERITTAAPDPRLGAVPGPRPKYRTHPGTPRRGLAAIASHRLRAPRRRLVTIAAGFGVLLAASAPFAITKLTSQSGPVKARVTRHEYHRAQHLLSLPPGYHWPKIDFPSNTVTGVGAGGGRAVVIDQIDWECYWVKAIRDGDVAAQHRAHTVLEGLLRHNIFVAPANASENWTPPAAPNYPYAVFADDGGYRYVSQAYAQAAAGHPQRLIERCRANRG